MSKALIIVGPRFQDHEMIYPFYRLQEAGLEVDIATTNCVNVVGDIGAEFPANLSTQSIVPDHYEILILPGGAKALEKIRQDIHAISAVGRMYYAGKIVGAMCHGTQLLISASVLKGKRATGYYSIKDDIINAGAEWIDAPVVVHDNIVTSPHYKYLGDFMRTVLGVWKARA